MGAHGEAAQPDNPRRAGVEAKAVRWLPFQPGEVFDDRDARGEQRSTSIPTTYMLMMFATSVREPTPSLRKMFDTWIAAVFGEM